MYYLIFIIFIIIICIQRHNLCIKIIYLFFTFLESNNTYIPIDTKSQEEILEIEIWKILRYIFKTIKYLIGFLYNLV